MLVWLPAMAPCQEDNQAPAAEQGLEAGSEDKTADEASDWQTDIDVFFGKYLVAPMAKVLFFDFWSPRWLRTEILDEVVCSNEKCGRKIVTAEEWPEGDVPIVLVCPECQSETATGISVPLVVVWLFVGAVFFTLRMGFINVRSFLHGVRLIRGDYDDPEETGEVSHFQALASALSATIGLGNIAGVAIAVGLGGPGAVFWMVLAGVIGMSSKFAECTLSQMYRKVSPDGTVSGGPMHYLHAGLKDLRPDSAWVGSLGRILAVVFAVLCVGASFGGGCAFQVVQSLNAVREGVPVLDDYPWAYGLIMAFMVGIVIIGGIRRIAATAEKIVPLMCCVYVVTTIYILLTHFSLIGWAFGQIFEGAFTPEAGLGGILGVMVLGMKRAAFSNEAGVGSAAIAHAAAKTEEPIREGIVASLGPFIDTVVICTMTGLAIIVTDVHNLHPEMVAKNEGAALTVEAFRTVGDWFPYILYVAVVLFAYSTMISWSYYGERCWSHLFGARTSLVYKLIFLVFVVLGSIVTARNILEFSDLMILAMAFPNILGVALLSGKIRERLDDYWKRYKSGEMEPNRNR
ncbi:MAG: alanine/glycine:cation symporter family protein [Thermoguttaceae bacterium]